MEDLVELILSYAGVLILALVLAVAFGAFLAIPAQWLWNEILPDLFGIVKISYIKMWGLLILLRILFPIGTGSSSS